MFITQHIQCPGAGAFETAPRLGGAVVGTRGPAFRPEEEGAGCQQRDGRSARPAPEDQGQVTTHARIQYEHERVYPMKTRYSQVAEMPE